MKTKTNLKNALRPQHGARRNHKKRRTRTKKRKISRKSKRKYTKIRTHKKKTMKGGIWPFGNCMGRQRDPNDDFDVNLNDGTGRTANQARDAARAAQRRREERDKLEAAKGDATSRFHGDHWTQGQ